MSSTVAQHETQGQVLLHAKQGLEGSLKPVNPDEMQEQEQEEGRMRPSLEFTGHQLFYVFGLDGVGAMLLSGGVNFALAYGEFNPLSSHHG